MDTTPLFHPSHGPTPGCARRFGELARGHWGGSESRNHWVRDVCMREDKTRSKNYHLNCNLSACASAWWHLKPTLWDRQIHERDYLFFRFDVWISRMLNRWWEIRRRPHRKNIRTINNQRMDKA